MDRFIILWINSILALFSASQLSEAALPSGWKTPVPVKEVYSTSLAPSNARGLMSENHHITAAGHYFVKSSSDSRKYAFVKDGRAEPVIEFTSDLVKFKTTFGEHFDLAIDYGPGEGSISLFCTFHQIDYAIDFFRLFRGNSAFKPQNLMVDRIETYDGTTNERGHFIRLNTILRQEFGNGGISDPTEFVLRCETSGLALTFKPAHYYITNVIRNKVVIKSTHPEAYVHHILYFYLVKSAENFHKYISKFSGGTLRAPAPLKNLLETSGSLP